MHCLAVERVTGTLAQLRLSAFAVSHVCVVNALQKNRTPPGSGVLPAAGAGGCLSVKRIPRGRGLRASHYASNYR